MNAPWRTFVTALLAIFQGAIGAHGQVRDITIVDAAGNNCIAFTPGTPATFFVRATFEEMMTPGVEFRISGLPAGWLVSATPSPVVDFNLGDPFGSGVQLTLDCGLSGSSAVLYVVTVLPVGPGPVVLSVMPHSLPPSGVPCPKFVFGVCEAPVDGFMCLPSGPRAVLGDQDYCRVTIAPRPWSVIKRLYR